jgi:hypothetical protein
MTLRSVFGPWPPRYPSSSLPSRLLPSSTPASTANLRLPNSTLPPISGAFFLRNIVFFGGGIGKSSILTTWPAYYILFRFGNFESVTSPYNR